MDSVCRFRELTVIYRDQYKFNTMAIGNIHANITLKAELSFIYLKHNFAQGSTATTLTIPTYIAGVLVGLVTSTRCSSSRSIALILLY